MATTDTKTSTPPPPPPPKHPEDSKTPGEYVPAPGQPGSQKISPPAGAGTDMGPPPERVGSWRLPVGAGEKRSIFEDQPGQQIPGRPAHPGHAKDEQHLRGRVVGGEDSPPPVGVPKGAILPGMQGTEHPDAPPLPDPNQPMEPEYIEKDK